MKLNGHELEMKYVLKINLLHEHIESPKTLDFIWVKKCRRDLKNRLQKLEQSLLDGFVSKKAFDILEQMIKEVL